MKKLLSAQLVGFALIAATAASAAPKIGEKLPEVTLSGDSGARVDGSPWSSSMIKDHAWTLFYVDPDEKDKNEALKHALKDAAFPKDKYGSIAVINMEATWLPNSAIAMKLKSTQKEYPDVVYVKDLDKVLVKKWGLKDDEYDTLLFDKNGKVLFSKDGELSTAEIKEVVDLIRNNL